MYKNNDFTAYFKMRGEVQWKGVVLCQHLHIHNN